MLLAWIVACRWSAPEPDSGPRAQDSTPQLDTTDSTGDTGERVFPAYNVIVVMTDDQATDTIWAMPETQARLFDESIQFDAAYQTNPLCCPARASFLSGGWYPAQTGVVRNFWPSGGVASFVDTDTLPTRLQELGITTAMIGKYMNEYETVAPYVAPGWDTWLALGEGDAGYAQTVVVGSTGPEASGVGTVVDMSGTHITTYIFDEAARFAEEHADAPFFLYVAPFSPHHGGKPAEEDRLLYEGFTRRPASWNEEDVSDKPFWIANLPLLDDAAAGEIDFDNIHMLRNLASLDRELAGFVERLDELDLLDRTVIFFTSDNGYTAGEHRLHGKGLPYVESIRVPTYVRVPEVNARLDARLIQVNTDIPATILDMFDAAPTGEGISLEDALRLPALPTREYVSINGNTGDNVAWAGVLTGRYVWVEWITGDTELYDLEADPGQLESLHLDPPADAQVAAWMTLADDNRGLAIAQAALPAGTVGREYAAQLEHWGGVAPITWTLVTATLPPGLTLDTDGRITGTLGDEEGTWRFEVRATDSSVSPATGQAQEHYGAFSITVGAGAPEAARVEGARVRVQTRPGVAVQLVVTPEPSDGPRHFSDVVIAGANGQATVEVEGLDPARRWYWVAMFDGVAGPRGTLGPVEL